MAGVCVHAASLCSRVRFLPAFCPEHCPVSLEQEFLPVAADTKEKKANERRLEPTIWALAWDSYALAAAALGQVGSFCLCACVRVGGHCPFCKMTFEAAQRHKLIVLELVVNASGKFTPLVGVLYDELARCACFVCARVGVSRVFCGSQEVVGGQGVQAGRRVLSG